ELAESVENILSRDQFDDERDVRVGVVDGKEEKTKAVAEVEQKSRVAVEKEKQAENERDELSAEVSTSFQDKRRQNVNQSEAMGSEGKRQPRRGKRTMDTPLHEKRFWQKPQKVDKTEAKGNKGYSTSSGRRQESTIARGLGSRNVNDKHELRNRAETTDERASDA
uniref:Uncharacterized protein n=1 Tax=Parascaris univalens TaxID=6257 RepID=A0A915CLM2_PARUN